MDTGKAAGKRSATSKKANARSAQRLRQGPILEPEARRAFEAAKPLFAGLRVPTLAAFNLAHETIEALVFSSQPKDSVGPKEALMFILSLRLSVRTLPGYATLHSAHINQIYAFVSAIEKYINDSSQQRPLNFLMLASPGAGKSHFIKCCAARLADHGVGAITFNMAGMQTNEDLVPALDSSRNLKVEDRLPLLFLDEFDSSPNNYALLLPLLWDGGLNLGPRDLRLGKVIVVMAGSSRAIPEAMDHARNMRDDLPGGPEHNSKLVDLFSRVNGGILRIPPFHDVAHAIDRRTDKVCVAVELLRKRFGLQLQHVPLGLLRFIAGLGFRYDVRSIAHLIDLIPYKNKAKKLTLQDLKLPVDSATRLKESSLAYHLLHEDQVLGVVKDWQEATKSSALIPIASGWVDIMMQMPPGAEELYFAQFFHALAEKP